MSTLPDDDAIPSLPGQTGLSKREYFAAHIMAGLAAHSGGPEQPGEAAEIAVDWADALITRLNLPANQPKRLTPNTKDDT